MGLTEIIIIAIGLAADSFAVAVSIGSTFKKMRIRYAVLLATIFGFFHFIMPCIGWKIGNIGKGYIDSFDHWIAFFLLIFIGGKMIFESRQQNKESENSKNPLKISNLLVLAFATSIDSLAVGVSLSLLEIDILTPVIIISLVTFTFAFVGTYIGNIFGYLFKDKVELVGGLILIAIGCKILLEHILLL
jgi:putative Mn2+ efflux pump MntP